MESRKVPALFALVGVIVAVALFLILKDDTADEDTTVAPPQQSATGEGPGEGKKRGEKAKAEKPAKPEVPRIDIKGGRPVGGVQQLGFEVGDEVKIEIHADAADEVHLHVYDIILAIPAGETRTLEFEATTDGLYELESHVTSAPLAEISITPS